MKPKENKGNKVGTYDDCQTPPYALEPLLPYLKKFHFIWECASGLGSLAIALGRDGHDVIFSDKETDFLAVVDTIGDAIVTNPPYSIKYKWLEKCYDLGKPFALLMPVEMLGSKSGQILFKEYDDTQVLFFFPRVDFLMRYSLWGGAGAQFPTAWFTWKLDLPKQMNYATLNKPTRKELPNYWKKTLGEETYFRLIKEAEIRNKEYRIKNNKEVVDFYEYLGIKRNE